MDTENESSKAFDMGALRSNLPQKRRGLSRYYSGKARSFACIADVQCLDDLKKKEHPDAKKRNTQQEIMPLNPYPCRTVSSSNQLVTPCVGV